MVCVEHTYILVACVFLMLVGYVLVVYAWFWSSLHLCHHVKVDGIVVGCVYHECMSIMHSLCMLVFICCYPYIDMVIVVVHEISMVMHW